MKKLFLIFSLFVVLSGCSSDNKGYGYDTNPNKNSDYQLKIEATKERRDAKRMKYYGRTGIKEGELGAYKGEFDGHTWYIFHNRNGESTVVVHDPNCKCLNKD